MNVAVLVVMGVSGAGKSTVGSCLAKRLQWPFKEGDEFHPRANIEKMRLGEPLTDADRAPWLAAIAAWIDGWLRGGVDGVVTCSALKRLYRDRLAAGRPSLVFVYLDGSPSVLAERVSKRAGHFMPAALLGSQLATLEPPAPDENAIIVDADQTVGAQIATVMAALSARGLQLADTGAG